MGNRQHLTWGPAGTRKPKVSHLTMKDAQEAARFEEERDPLGGCVLCIVVMCAVPCTSVALGRSAREGTRAVGFSTSRTKWGRVRQGVSRWRTLGYLPFVLLILEEDFLVQIAEKGLHRPELVIY